MAEQFQALGGAVVEEEGLGTKEGVALLIGLGLGQLTQHFQGGLKSLVVACQALIGGAVAPLLAQLAGRGTAGRLWQAGQLLPIGGLEEEGLDEILQPLLLVGVRGRGDRLLGSPASGPQVPLGTVEVCQDLCCPGVVRLADEGFKIGNALVELAA